MKRSWSSVCIFSLLLISSHALAGTVYRNVDRNGNVTYSDTPSGSHSQSIEIDTSLSPQEQAEQARIKEQQKRERKKWTRETKMKTKLLSHLRKINQNLERLKSKKQQAIEDRQKCMARIQVIVHDPKACKQPGMDEQACLAEQKVTRKPATKENCTPPYYSRLLQTIEKREKSAEKVKAQLDKLSPY